MGKIIKFDEILNRNPFEDYEVIDTINTTKIMEEYEIDRMDIACAADTVELHYEYYPTYCFEIREQEIIVYLNKECPEDEKNYCYNQEEFVKLLKLQIKEDKEMEQ